MSLVQGKMFKLHAVRRFSHDRHIKKSVFFSLSKDIFTNLALEDWLYRNFDFANHHILMLWQSDPCVVIGRHQNPWLEANVSELDKIIDGGVQLARRNSGGGTVYHDHGNLNLTFFTSRDSYNRKSNLTIITRALFKEYGINLEISAREDLTLKDCKVSGTAAKLGRPNAYHHCTLLVNSNKNDLRRALQKNDWGIETNATKSIRSPIINLLDVDPTVSVGSLYNVIAEQYLDSVSDKDMQAIDPNEEKFPGILEIRNTFESWEWRFGKTPKFQICSSFAVLEMQENVKVTAVVEKGIFSEILCDIPLGLTESCGQVTFANLIGQRFSNDMLAYLEWTFVTFINGKNRLMASK